jgi:hypothetical protein
MNISSQQIVYSEHDYDECFEYKNGSGRVPNGNAIGYEIQDHDLAGAFDTLILFEDIIYSKYDHKYWDNYELEHDINRVII